MNAVSRSWDWSGTWGSRVARLVLVSEISPYAHLKHLGVRAVGIGGP